MTIIKWDPFRNVTTLQDRINRLFEDSFPHSSQQREELELTPCAWRPMVDIYETESGIVIEADLPGVAKEDVAVEVKDNMLSISGQKESHVEVDNESYYRRERCQGSFHRAFTLQTPIAPDKIKAKFKDGVLYVEIPKPEEERPKQITVDVE
jgi:HSP20 family protein